MDITLKHYKKKTSKKIMQLHTHVCMYVRESNINMHVQCMDFSSLPCKASNFIHWLIISYFFTFYFVTLQPPQPTFTFPYQSCSISCKKPQHSHSTYNYLHKHIWMYGVCVYVRLSLTIVPHKHTHTPGNT